MKTFKIKADKIVSYNKEIVNGSFDIVANKFANIGYSTNNNFNYYFKGSTIYPAFINAHDHLLGTYYPRVGKNRPYLNWSPWDQYLKSSPQYYERALLSNYTLYKLGCIRNLISGVTTVSDHIPKEINKNFIDDMPIRVIKDYSLSHEVSSYDLKWGDGVDIEYKSSIENNHPYITHLEEGFDQEALNGVDYLNKYNALSSNTVLIHCIGLSDKDIDIIYKKRANIVWCPFSNYYMFNKTARINEIFEKGINISIGTDSPMSGEYNILNEVKFAKKIFYKEYNFNINNKDLYNMITLNPSKAMGLNLGVIKNNYISDFLILNNKFKCPYLNIINASVVDIKLIFYNGKPVYGSFIYLDVFKEFNVSVDVIYNYGKKYLIDSSFNIYILNNKFIFDRLKYIKNLPFYVIR